MRYRTATLFSSILTFAAVLTSGCGYNQQSRFQMSFLPPAPHPTATVPDLADAPALPANSYLQDVPLLNTSGLVPPRRSRGDALVQRADQAFQRGRKFYQANDAPSARVEFNHAIDWMLEASDQNPADRQDFERRLDEMIETIHRFDRVGLGASADIDQAQFEKAPLEDILQMTFPVDPKLKAKVHEQVGATVSQLPLMVTDPVLGYIHYFAGPGKKTLLAGMERSGRYRPMIQRILDEEGVPQELIHLAQAESGFLPRAMSRKAAAGMWQFVAWRGREYGLNQNRYSDDRLDPEKATRAAARHLRDLYQKFGDWHLAIAAYDCGPGVIERAVERTGYADFFEMRNRRVLPLETTNYVPIIMAMTIMSKNAAEYGLDGIVSDPPLEYDNVAVTSPTHLALVADITNIPVPELHDLNPSLLRGLAPAGYSLHVPKGTGSYLMAALQMVPEERRASWRVHKVEDGETLATIGKRFRTTPATIAAANHILSASPAVGDQLLIPAAYHETEPVRTVHAKSSKGRRTAASKNHPTSTHHGRTVASKTRVHRAAGFSEGTSKVARASR